MGSPEEQIGQAFAAIRRDQEEEAQRQKYRAAMAILKTIPSGTPDEDLTAEQRQAWKDHDDAIRWLEKEG